MKPKIHSTRHFVQTAMKGVDPLFFWAANLAVTHPPYAFLFEKPALKNPENPMKIGFAAVSVLSKDLTQQAPKAAQSLATPEQTSYSYPSFQKL